MQSNFAIVIVLGAAALLSSPAKAQDATTGMPGQSRSGGPSQGAEFGKPGAPVAPVGAGTTNSSTTGVSGPKKSASGKPGEISAPPLPNVAQCEPYKTSPAYEWCLRVVLREK